MLSMRFVLDYDSERSGTGWRPEHQPDFDPMQGMGVAHDLLEHFPDDDAGVERELQAFRSILLIRVEHGDLDPRSLATEFPDIMAKLHYNETDLVRRAPRTRPLQEGLEEFLS